MILQTIFTLSYPLLLIPCPILPVMIIDRIITPSPSQGHTSYITSVAFSPDGRLVATGSWDKVAIVWDISTGKQSVVLKVRTCLTNNRGMVDVARVCACDCLHACAHMCTAGCGLGGKVEIRP